jgi:hypothetical protein
MPDSNEFEVVLRAAFCERCETLGTGRWDPQAGTFEWCCACTEISLTGITKQDGPGELRCVTQSARMVGIRPSRRLISMSRGRIWREVWRCEQGIILQCAKDFVTILEQDGRQIWSTDFSFSFTLLTGQPWRPEGGDLCAES